jgi:hypothetical protein
MAFTMQIFSAWCFRVFRSVFEDSGVQTWCFLHGKAGASCGESVAGSISKSATKDVDTFSVFILVRPAACLAFLKVLSHPLTLLV